MQLRGEIMVVHINIVVAENQEGKIAVEVLLDFLVVEFGKP